MTSTHMFTQRGYISKNMFDLWKKEKKFSLIADGIRYNTVLSVARAGTGHLGASLSMIEMLTDIYFRSFDFSPKKTTDNNRDIFILSKGHAVPGLYALLASRGYIDTDELDTLRRWNGLAGHSDTETQGIEANTGSLAMGISKAIGHSIVKKRLGLDGNVVVIVGDAELQEGQCWEALLSAVNFSCDNVYVFIDDNKVQTDRYTRDIVKYGNLLSAIGEMGWFVQEGDGGSLDGIHDVCTKAQRCQGKPKLIWLHTKKGQGVSYMEHQHVLLSDNDRYVWHNRPPQHNELIEALSEIMKRMSSHGVLFSEPIEKIVVPSEIPLAPMQKDILGKKIIDGFAQALVDWGKRDSRVVVLDADLEEDCGFIPFHSAYPDRFYEMGIMEQHLVSTASSFSRYGLIPVFGSYAAFITSRSNEQIYNYASEYGRGVIVGNMSGVIPATPGKSHQGYRDIACMKSIPGIRMYQPVTPQECDNMIRRYEKGEFGDLLYVRMSLASPKVPLPIVTEDLSIGLPYCVREGNDVDIIALGPVLVAESVIAAEKVFSEGISVRVLHHPWITDIDDAIFEKKRPLVIVEDHYYQGGMGETLIARVGRDQRSNIAHLAIRQVPRTGFRDEALSGCGLSASDIAIAIRKVFHG